MRQYNPVARVVVEGIDLLRSFRDAVISVTVEDHLAEADAATFEITNRENAVIDHNLFDRGAQVDVSIGYGTHPTKLFEGSITEVEPGWPEDGVSTVTMTAHDRTHSMRQKGQRQNVFPDRTYADIVREIAFRHRFRADDVIAEEPQAGAKRFSQDAENDWEFLQGMAKEVGFEFKVELDSRGQSKLYFRKPRTKPSEFIGTFTYGANLKSFGASLSVEKPVSKVIVRGWDEIKKEPYSIEVDATASRDVLGREAAIDYIHGGDEVEAVRILDDVVPRSREHATTVATAYLRQQEFKLISGRGAVVGDSRIRSGRVLRIEGLGTKFSGDYYLTGVTHRYDDSGYACEFECRRNAISRSRTESQRDRKALEETGYQLEAGGGRFRGKGATGSW